jgi:hypothetical protein
MNHRPILDAGPALNFLSIHQEKLLVATAGPLAAPEIVQAEVLRKAECDRCFAAAAPVWRRMTPKWLEMLPDDQTPELAAVVQRISGLPTADRCRQSTDLRAAAGTR